MAFLGDKVDEVSGLAGAIRADDVLRQLPTGQWLASGSPATNRVSVSHRATPTEAFELAGVIGSNGIGVIGSSIWDGLLGIPSAQFGASIASLGGVSGTDRVRVAIGTPGGAGGEGVVALVEV